MIHRFRKAVRMSLNRTLVFSPSQCGSLHRRERSLWDQKCPSDSVSRCDSSSCSSSLWLKHSVKTEEQSWTELYFWPTTAQTASGDIYSNAVIKQTKTNQKNQFWFTLHKWAIRSESPVKSWSLWSVAVTTCHDGLRVPAVSALGVDQDESLMIKRLVTMVT